MTNVDVALARVRDGMTLGLGSGAASERFLHELGHRVQQGLQIRGVPTSHRIAQLATDLGIPLVELADAIPLDLAVDGADEVDPNIDLIKGYGKALVREKIVAAAAKEFIVLIGPDRVAEKRVQQLGERGKLPIEVVPFALPWVLHTLSERGMPATVLPDTSDNGNRIVHASVTAIPNAMALDQELHLIPGVVDTGLFVQMATCVLAQVGDEVIELRRAS